MTDYHIRRSSYEPSHWDEGSDSDQVRAMNRDGWLVGHRKILAWQWAKLPRYGREGAVEVRPFPAKRRLCVSEVQGLSGEAVKGNPPTTVIPGVDESKSSPRTNRRLDRTTEPNLLIPSKVTDGWGFTGVSFSWILVGCRRNRSV